MGDYKKFSQIINEIADHSDKPKKKVIFNAFFDGEVPIGSGLSSSSALGVFSYLF